MPAWFSSGDRVLITEALSPVGRYRLIALAPDGSGTQSQLADGCCAQMTPDGSRLLFALEERGTLRLRAARRTRRQWPGGNSAEDIRQRSEPKVCCFDRFALAPSGRLLAYVDVNESGTRTATNEISRWRRAVAYRDSRWTGRHLGIALVAEDERTAVSENWRQSDSRAALVGSRERWALGNGRQRGAALRRPPCRRPWRLRRLTGRPHAVSGPSSARKDGSARRCNVTS